MKKGGRRIAHAAAVLGLATIAVSVVLLRPRLIEEWYLLQLRSGSPEARAVAIDKLGEVGSETALLRLHGYALKQQKGAISIGRTITELVGTNMLVTSFRMFYESENHGWDWRLFRALDNIKERIGPSREIACYVKAIEREAAEPHLRVYLSAHAVLATLGPSAMHAVEMGKSQAEAEDPGFDCDAFRRERGNLIESLVSLLKNSDEHCQAVSIRILGWCGPEAAAAIPELEIAALNPRSGLRTEATQALLLIRSRWAEPNQR